MKHALAHIKIHGRYIYMVEVYGNDHEEDVTRKCFTNTDAVRKAIPHLQSNPNSTEKKGKKQSNTYTITKQPKLHLKKGKKTKQHEHDNTYTSTVVVAVLLNGTAVIYSDGRVSRECDDLEDMQDYVFAPDVNPQQKPRDDKNKMFCIKDYLFRSFCGQLRHCGWVVKQVIDQIKKVPVQSTNEIAAAFVYWCNIKFSTTMTNIEGKRVDDEDIPDFILIGRLHNENRLHLIKIESYDND